MTALLFGFLFVVRGVARGCPRLDHRVSGAQRRAGRKSLGPGRERVKGEGGNEKARRVDRADLYVLWLPDQGSNLGPAD